MTLPSSGAITLNNVNVELGLSGTAAITMNDTILRKLFGKISGQISMSDGYNKSVTIAVAHAGSPYVSMYKWLNGFGTKYANPSVLPTSIAQDVAFAPATDFISIAQVSTVSDSLCAYAWSSSTGFGTKYTATSGDDGYDTAFSPSGNHVAVTTVDIGRGTSLRIVVYPWSNGFGTKIADPAALPTGESYGVTFSPSGSHIAVAHDINPYISVYPWSNGFGTKIVNPATLPTGNGRSVAFTPSGNYIAIGHVNSIYVTAYPWSAGFGTKVANPATLPTGTGYGVGFSSSGSHIAVAHNNSPYVTAYPWSAGFGTKVADPATLPTGTGYGVSFS